MVTEEYEKDTTKKYLRDYWDFGSKYYDTSPGLYSSEEMECWTKEVATAIGDKKIHSA